jgi:hypothetical protein
MGWEREDEKAANFPLFHQGEGVTEMDWDHGSGEKKVFAVKSFN